MEQQIHLERKFYLDKKTGYWISTDYPRIRAHVWVWINNRGVIPKGFHIHHLDGNKSNNFIENLSCVCVKDHIAIHSSAERTDFLRKWVDLIRPLTKKWHRSEEGLEWHSKHGKECWDNKEVIQKSCDFCEKEFSTKTYFQRFCSNACKSAHRRKERIDDIDLGCEFCGAFFRSNKYAKRRFCSRGCSSKIGKEAK